jgi:hypothetical protein
MTEPRYEIQYYKHMETKTFHILDTTINVNEDIHPICHQVFMRPLPLNMIKPAMKQ